MNAHCITNEKKGPDFGMGKISARFPSTFCIGQSVIVSPSEQKTQYLGTVAFIEHKLIYPWYPLGGTTDYIYIQFDGIVGRTAYKDWLKQGSEIIVQRAFSGKKICIIETIYYDVLTGAIASIDIAEKERVMLHPTRYSVSPSEIHAMLIWREAFTIEPV